MYDKEKGYESQKAKVKRNNFRKMRQQVSDGNSVYGKKKQPMNRARKRRTWPEQETQYILDELEIKYEIEKPLPFQNGFKYYDLLLIDYNILIEVDGDYWHGDLKETNKNALFIKIKNKQNDYIKNVAAKLNNYYLLRIKEKDLKESRCKVKDQIKKFIEEVSDDCER